jgi:hypothetical protein
MPRRKGQAKARPSTVRAYGAKRPTVNLALIEQQYDQCHAYRRVLVDLERDRQIRTNRLLCRGSADVAYCQAQLWEIEHQIRETYKELNRQRAAARKRIKVPELEERVTALKNERPPYWKLQKKALAKARERPAFITAAKVINDDNLVRYKAARAASGLYWGTYLGVEEAMADSKADTFGLPTCPEYRGDGKLGVQFQKSASTGGPMTVEHLLSCRDSRARMSRIAGKVKLWKLQFRIGSNPDNVREPIWGEIPVFLHRPLPEDEGTNITWLHVTRRRVATRFEYKVIFTLARDEPWTKPKGSGEVGIDVGWRRVPQGLRVAYWVGHDGRSGELIIPGGDRHTPRRQRKLSGWDKVRSLQSIRDKNFDTLKLQVGTYFKTLGDQAPEWVREILGHIHLWRSQDRMKKLVLEQWSSQSLPGDHEIQQTVADWFRQDDHLYDWEENARKHLQDWRLHLYREFAAEMRTKYGTIYLEELDLRNFAERPQPEQEERDGALDEYRTIAALYLLRNCLKGPDTEYLPAVNTTRTCHLCQHVNTFTDPTLLLQTCTNCGEEWDQDFNAGNNVLLAGQALRAAD